jgi:CheY-like chemotaxis protein
VLRRRYGGLGLGLAISQSVVEAHGGRLTASSAGKDQGASFTIELVALPGPIESPVASDTPRLAPCHGAQPRPEGLRVLLIEDNADTLRVVARLLRERGHAVSTATDFRTARELATSSVFDLIISDIELPDGSGLEIIREASRIRPTPAIALSGFGSAEDVILSRDAGFAEHLTKPIRIGDLDAAIARVVPRTSEDSSHGTPLPPQPPVLPQPRARTSPSLAPASPRLCRTSSPSSMSRPPATEGMDSAGIEPEMTPIVSRGDANDPRRPWRPAREGLEVVTTTRRGLHDPLARAIEDQAGPERS